MQTQKIQYRASIYKRAKEERGRNLESSWIPESVPRKFDWDPVGMQTEKGKISTHVYKFRTERAPDVERQI